MLLDVRGEGGAIDGLERRFQRGGIDEVLPGELFDRDPPLHVPQELIVDLPNDLQLLRRILRQLLLILRPGQVQKQLQDLQALIGEPQVLRLAVKAGKDAPRLLVSLQERHRAVQTEFFPQQLPGDARLREQRLRRHLPQVHGDGEPPVLPGGELKQGIGADIQRVHGKIPRVEKDAAPVPHAPRGLPGPAVIDLHDMRKRLMPMGEGVRHDVHVRQLNAVVEVDALPLAAPGERFKIMHHGVPPAPPDR